jgi:hypothetical protein
MHILETSRHFNALSPSELYINAIISMFVTISPYADVCAYGGGSLLNKEGPNTNVSFNFQLHTEGTCDKVIFSGQDMAIYN